MWSLTESDRTEIGTINRDYPHLAADGSTVAWVEPGEVPVFTVFDQATGRTVHDSLLNTAGMSDVRDGKNAAVVYAVDGVTVYVKNPQGAVAWDTATGSTSVLDPDANGFAINDVKDGRFAYHREGDGGGDFIGPDLTSGTRFAGTLDFLSPGGRYVMGELPEDSVGIFDTATAEQLPQPSAAGYQYFGGYQWLDDSTFAAIGFRSTEDGSPADVLTCQAATGACEMTAHDAGTLGEGFVIPLGVSID